MTAAPTTEGIVHTVVIAALEQLGAVNVRADGSSVVATFKATGPGERDARVRVSPVEPFPAPVVDGSRIVYRFPRLGTYTDTVDIETPR